MYTIQPVVQRTSLKAKTFRSKNSVHRFMLGILNQYGLQVDTIIDQNTSGQQEFVCTDHTSRFFISTV